MQTIVETPIFIRRAKQVGVSDEELDQIKTLLAKTPDAGDEIAGTGGARKVRFAAKGKGKSGGYRIITFYSGEDIPVFLLDVYAKSEKVNLSQQEKNILKSILSKIVEIYRSREDE